ncbi:cytochrome b/b6 domain-containing protein [Mucilaginibacter sp. McL0603]|uniref:cytochrome b/b6 domain-containing protein n=1 Tax=Mucilaginibacter sp. McL0603 TaxID=3415670 RepID=UPI003CEA5EF4
MTVIEPSIKDIEHLNQKKKYSSPLRLWHWLSAIVITGSLLTVLANSTITNNRKNAAIIKTELLNNKIAVNSDQARSAAHEISDKVWELHTYFGYILAALLLFRLIVEILQPADQKLIPKIKSAYSNYLVIKQHRELARQEFVVKTLYAVFYLLLMIMVVTGLCLAFEDNVAALKKIHAIKEIHGFCMYLIIAFIVVHLAGVFLAERKDSPGIVSDMINGGKADS